jgi:hypothetical protein
MFIRRLLFLVLSEVNWCAKFDDNLGSLSALAALRTM